jgi:hypothetical protein
MGDYANPSCMDSIAESARHSVSDGVGCGRVRLVVSAPRQGLDDRLLLTAANYPDFRTGLKKCCKSLFCSSGVPDLGVPRVKLGHVCASEAESIGLGQRSGH